MRPPGAAWLAQVVTDNPAPQRHDEMLSDIEAFMAAHRVTATGFGAQCLGDPNLVFQLRSGRELRRATRDRVKRFIVTSGNTEAAA